MTISIELSNQVSPIPRELFVLGLSLCVQVQADKVPMIDSFRSFCSRYSAVWREVFGVCAHSQSELHQRFWGRSVEPVSRLDDALSRRAGVVFREKVSLAIEDHRASTAFCISDRCSSSEPRPEEHSALKRWLHSTRR